MGDFGRIMARVGVGLSTQCSGRGSIQINLGAATGLRTESSCLERGGGMDWSLSGGSCQVLQ